MTPNDWIAGRDTGVSSKTIWCVMTGTTCLSPGTPADDDDFGRCYRLLKAFPAWRARLGEMAAAYRSWVPLVPLWPELERLHEAGQPRAVYDLIGTVRKEIMAADGWSKIGEGIWSRGLDT